jgi:hypothetical protein
MTYKITFEEHGRIFVCKTAYQRVFMQFLNFRIDAAHLPMKCDIQPFQNEVKRSSQQLLCRGDAWFQSVRVRS